MKFILLYLLIAVKLFPNEIIYTDPVKGSIMVQPENNISIGYKDPLLVTNIDEILKCIKVEGSIGGIYNGSILITETNKKIIFKPNNPFLPGEKVNIELTAYLSKRNKTGTETYSYSFKIADKKIICDPVKTMERETGMILNTQVMQAAPPELIISVNNNPYPGKFFLAPLAGYSYNSIINNNGSSFWYQQYSVFTYDFKMHPNGNLTYFASNPPRFIEMDRNYNFVHTYTSGNGYTTDMHDIQIQPNGNAYLMAYDPQHVDMSQIVRGGNPNATVIGLIIQEVDLQNNVLFQWRSWDHMQITDAVRENLLDSVIDYVHGNAIEIDNDNNILISSRHLDEITKINRSTGNIMWRFGGKNNMFTIYNDSMQFRHQHDIRRISNGNITFFDNGTFRSPDFARAVEYNINEVNLTADLVWQFQRYPQAIAPWGGNVQRLPNGNTLIAWGGSYNTLTEVTPGGTVVFDASYPPGVNTYRGYKYIYPPDPTGINSTENEPVSFKLEQNYPNPFNPQTTVKFSLIEPAVTSIIIYDIKGSLIKHCFSGFLSKGSHTLVIDGKEISSGIYFYQLISGKYTDTGKMILVK